MSRTTEPTHITQGERIAWTKAISGYPADEWDLQYRFRGQGYGFNVDATADDTAFEAEITAEQSATMQFGETYEWQAWLTEIADPDNTFVILTGTIDVKRGFVEGAARAVDLRTPAQIGLDSIDAALLAFATSDIVEYEISTPTGSRRVKRSDKANLMKLRSEFAKRVSVENTKRRVDNGGPLMRSVPIVVRGC